MTEMDLVLSATHNLTGTFSISTSCPIRAIFTDSCSLELQEGFFRKSITVLAYNIFATIYTVTNSKNS